MSSINCILLNNSLGGFTPIIDSTGKITGYKTKVGADTVFPFSGGISEFTFNSTSSFSAEIGAKYDIICATAYYQNAKSKLQGATIINEYCEYNLSNAGYLYCAEIEATQNVVSFAGVSYIGLGYLKK